MPKFRKKPIVVEAVLAGDVLDDISNKLRASPRWIVDAFEHMTIGFAMDAVLINTLEGQMRASRTDWIICGVKGELYACRNDIFKQTYEPVDG